MVPLSARSENGSLNSQGSQRNVTRKSTITLDTLGLPADTTTQSTSSRAKVDAFPRSSPRTNKAMPPIPATNSPPRIQNIPLPGPITGFSDASSIGSRKDPVRAEKQIEPLVSPKPKHPLQPQRDESSAVQTIESMLVYPLTSMPNLPTPPSSSRRENPWKMDVKDLKVSIPDLEKVEQQQEIKPGSRGRMFSDDTLKNDSGLLALSREVGKRNSVSNSIASASRNSLSAIQITDFSAPPKPVKKPVAHRANSRKKDKRRSRDIPQPRTPPRIPLPTPPRKKAVPQSRLPRPVGPPLRKKIPSKLKERLSKDLESARNSDASNTEDQTYTEVLVLLSDVVADAVEDDVDISRHIETIRQSLTDRTLSDKDAKRELKRLSKAAQQSKHASRAMLNIYSALSTLPTEAALTMIEEVLENPTRTSSQKTNRTRNSRASGGSVAKRSRNKMLSEFDSELGQKLNEKLAKYEDPSSVITYNNLLIPNMERSHSGSSMRILQHLDSEVDLKLAAARQEQRASPDSSVRSSLQFDDNIRIAEKASSSPLWMPSPKVWAPAENSSSPKIRNTSENIVQPKIPGPTLSDYMAEEDVISPTESGLTNSPGPRWLTLSFDDPSPLTTLNFATEPSKVDVRKATPVRSAPSQNVTVLSKQAGLWKPVPPPKPMAQSYGLWNAPQETTNVVKRHRLLDFSSGPDSPTAKPISPPLPTESRTTEYGSNGLWKASVPVELPKAAPLWQGSQRAGADAGASFRDKFSESRIENNTKAKGSANDPNAAEDEAKLWSPHPHRTASIAASRKGLWRNDARVTIRYQRTHRQWPYVGTVRYPRKGQPSEYRAQSYFEDREGLWERPDPKEKLSPAMWMNQRRSEFIPRDSELPAVSLKEGDFLDEVNFYLESRFSSPIV